MFREGYLIRSRRMWMLLALYMLEQNLENVFQFFRQGASHGYWNSELSSRFLPQLKHAEYRNMAGTLE